MARELPTLGELELQVLRLVWQEQPCTERQISDRLQQERAVARTTVLKTMQRLEAKGLLVPNRPWRLFGPRECFYTTEQLTVLRYLLRSRRAWEAARRACPAPIEVRGRAARAAAPPGRGGDVRDDRSENPR